MSGEPDNGCSYGRGTRWAVGICLTIYLGMMGAVFSMTVSAKKQAQEISSRLYRSREEIGRLDERLKSINSSLARIERMLRKQRQNRREGDE